ncbi:MAG: NDP-sugar synthase [Acidobacteria bacterium]|nr:NDP-sugar synthase [Acidobacteriota bacterium]
MKAMVLAAGLGTRARPLTDRYAKPALPVPGSTVLTHVLGMIKAAGISDVALNLHYKPESLLHALKEYPVEGVNVSTFDEPVIAGSGGGFFRIKDFFGREPFLISNGDSIPLIDFKKLLHFHETHNLPVSFLSRPDKTGSERVIDADSAGVVRAIRKIPTPTEELTSYQFCGAMVIDPMIFEYDPGMEVFDFFGDLLIPMLENGKMVGKVFSSNFQWLDFGNVNDYFFNSYIYLSKEYVQGDIKPRHNIVGDSVVHENTRIAVDVTLTARNYIGAGVEIRSSSITNSIILPGARVMDAEIIDSIIFPGLRITGGHNSEIAYGQDLFLNIPYF